MSDIESWEQDGRAGKNIPPEVYDYNDDVSSDTVAEIRKDRGVDTSRKKWKLIDAQAYEIRTVRALPIPTTEKANESI